MAKILVVDDDPDIVAVLKEALEFDDHSVLTASNGLEAIARLYSDPLPDIVLADVMMPIMNGKELLKRIRAIPCTARLPVILITGASPYSDDFPDCGAYQALIKKPFDIWDVASCVNSLLNDSTLEVEPA